MVAQPWLRVAAAALLFPAGVADAQTPDTAIRHSARCFIAFASLGGQEEATLKISGVMGSLFFAGQIFGAQPGVDLTDLLKREALATSDTQIRQSLVQCGEELKLRGDQLTAAGEALKHMAPDAH